MSEDGKRSRRIAAVLFAVIAGSALAQAQEFKAFGRTVQVHGFGSQGYAFSNENNFLTMYTSHGSPAFTEGALNLSMPINDKLRIGGQGYTRKIGSLDDFRPQLDWAYADFKPAAWLGFRGGKVKTTLGLYNDTQDMAFLYPWALLPQGVYPTDLRTTYIAHTGGDAYGRISLRKAGKLNYTVYGGKRPFDDREGYYYFSLANGFNITSISGRILGADLKYLPLKGLTLGTSWADSTLHRQGAFVSGAFVGFHYAIDANPERIWSGYLDYVKKKWEISGEYRNNNIYDDISFIGFGSGAPLHYNQCTWNWFGSAAYRATSKLQFGVYHSQLHVINPANPANTASNHILDEVGAARYDLNRFWDLKAEGHFMDGYGDIYSAQGFYSQWNPAGLKPKTNLLMLRTTFKF